MRHRVLRPMTAALAAALFLAACGSDDDTGATDTEAIDEDVDDDFDDDEFEDLDGEEGEGADGELFDCSLESLQGGDEEFAFVVAYDVIDGGLGATCFGDDNAVTAAAWKALATIAPASQLSDIVLFGGYEPDGDGAAETLAFVSALDADGTGFLMAVNNATTEAEPDEMLLTMAHEFTHVFTATPDQMDRSEEAIETCDTYVSGDGCYLPDALMLAWIDEFWDDDVLAGVDVTQDDPVAAEERCVDDDGFFGAYAATNPEEDFAEAFSAFVFEVEPVTDGQAGRLAWIAAQPGLAEFRDDAIAADLTPLPNNFDVCGS